MVGNWKYEWNQLYKNSTEFPSEYTSWDTDQLDIAAQKIFAALSIDSRKLKFHTAYFFNLSVTHSALPGVVGNVRLLLFPRSATEVLLIDCDGFGHKMAKTDSNTKDFII